MNCPLYADRMTVYTTPYIDSNAHIRTQLLYHITFRNPFKHLCIAAWPTPSLTDGAITDGPRIPPVAETCRCRRELYRPDGFAWWPSHMSPHHVSLDPKRGGARPSHAHISNSKTLRDDTWSCSRQIWTLGQSILLTACCIVFYGLEIRQKRARRWKSLPMPSLSSEVVLRARSLLDHGVPMWERSLCIWWTMGFNAREIRQVGGHHRHLRVYLQVSSEVSLPTRSLLDHGTVTWRFNVYMRWFMALNAPEMRYSVDASHLVFESHPFALVRTA